MGSSAPDPPDYRAAAIEQGEAARDVTRMQTYANRPDQYTPFGSSTWDASAITDPSTGLPTTRWAQNLVLDPASQQALEGQQDIVAGRTALSRGLMGSAATELESPTGFFDDLPSVGGTPDLPGYYGAGLTNMGVVPGRTEPVNFEGMMGPSPSEVSRSVTPENQWSMFNAGGGPEQGGVASGMMQSGLDFTGAGDVGTGATTRNRVEDAMYGRSTSRLDPQWQQGQQALESRLVNQGLRAGDAAYDTQIENFNRARSDAYAGARQDAIIAGGAEATREFGMDLGRRQQTVGELAQSGGFANQAQAQAYSQALSGRGVSDQAQQRLYDQNKAAAAFRNQAVNQAFQNQMAGGGFSNQAQAQQFAQAAALRGEASGAAGAQFEQAMAQSRYADAQRQQQVGEQLAMGGQAFSQGIQGAGFQNQVRQQAIAEQMQREGWSLNKINALLSGQQVQQPSMPNFAQATKAEPTQYLAAADMQGQASLDAFNAEQAALQGMMSGAGSLATGVGAMGWTPFGSGAG